MRTAYIGLGANLGDRRGNIRRALRLLAATPGVRIGRVSRLYNTKPEGYAAQPDFLNGVAAVHTKLGSRGLLRRLKEIERELGRSKGRRNGPRLIDLDLLLYSRTELRCRGLIIPHPRLQQRGFVLRPMAEIAAGVIHPVSRKRMGTLWREHQRWKRESVKCPTPKV